MTETLPPRLEDATHEAAHAVVMHALGGRVVGIELHDPGTHLTNAGTCRIISVQHDDDPPVLAVLREITAAVSSGTATSAFSGQWPHPERVRGDFEHATRLALRICHTEDHAVLLVLGLEALARDLVRRPDLQRQIAFVAAALAADGELDASQIEGAIRHAG